MSEPAVSDRLIEGYLARLGFDHRPPPARASLDRLVARHLEEVPFENLDVQQRRPIVLGAAVAVEKIALRRRGGFCFELNEAFRALLEALGFAVHRVEGQVWLEGEQRFGAAFDHLALVVTIDGAEWLVDVGFGDNNRAPMALRGEEATDVSGSYRLSDSGSDHRLLARTAGDTVRPLYRLSLQPQPLPAFAAMCAYHQSSPDSMFTNGLICTRATPSGRITLSQHRLILVDAGRREEWPAADTETRARFLGEHFGISA